MPSPPLGAPGGASSAAMPAPRVGTAGPDPDNSASRRRVCPAAPIASYSRAASRSSPSSALRRPSSSRMMGSWVSTPISPVTSANAAARPARALPPPAGSADVARASEQGQELEYAGPLSTRHRHRLVRSHSGGGRVAARRTSQGEMREDRGFREQPAAFLPAHGQRALARGGPLGRPTSDHLACASPSSARTRVPVLPVSSETRTASVAALVVSLPSPDGTCQPPCDTGSAESVGRHRQRRR